MMNHQRTAAEKSYKRKAAKNVSVKEAEKVGHDINNIYHAKYNGKRSGMITTYNPDDDIAYNYAFECHGFGEYNIFSKVEKCRLGGAFYGRGIERGS